MIRLINELEEIKGFLTAYERGWLPYDAEHVSKLQGRRHEIEFSLELRVHKKERDNHANNKR